MVENSTSLPTGAGAVTHDRPNTPDAGSPAMFGGGNSNGIQSGSSSRQEPAGFSAGESGYTSEGRDLVVLNERSRPSTATVFGAALAGAVVGGAIPFMLGSRSSSGGSASSSRRQDTVVTESVIIDRSPRELYDFWRDVTNLPRFMDNIKEVEKLDEKRSRWVIKAPAGTSVEFDSRITEDVPGRLIAWQSEEGASVPNRGRVEFFETASGTATNVRATISYEPPAGAAGRIAAKLFQREPSVQARDDLARLKRLMEEGRA